MSPKSSVRIPYRGKSMYPAIRDGETLVVSFLASDITNALTQGSLVIHKDDHEIMVHRIVDGKIISDWGGGCWETKPIGIVTKIETAKGELLLSQSTNRLYGFLARGTGSEFSILRKVSKVGLMIVSFVERLQSTKKPI